MKTDGEKSNEIIIMSILEMKNFTIAINTNKAVDGLFLLPHNSQWELFVL